MNFELTYEDHCVQTQGGRPEGETVLDALLRAGIDVPFSCKSGTCLSCMMQCMEGRIDPQAQRGLSEHLARMHYFLPCQCQTTGDMRLRAPQPEDMVTACMLCESMESEEGTVQLIFEPQGTLRYRQGQTLRVVSPGSVGPEAEIRISSDPAVDILMQGQLHAREGGSLPAPLLPGAEFGLLFDIRGPYDDTPARELAAPVTDPALWQELGCGTKVRAVLEAFYPKVYANAQLAPFFRGVTMERSIDKQYSFLRQSMTYDRGSEMACHAELSKRLKLDIWFCDPHAPWQRGSNENTNGLLRQFLPKGADLSEVSQTTLNDIARLMNGRPRQTLRKSCPKSSRNSTKPLHLTLETKICSLKYQMKLS